MFLDKKNSYLVKLAGCASIFVATFFIIIKFSAWITTGSVSIKATLVDSIIDTISSIVILISVYHSHQPPDKLHKFGHGKIEAIAALLQGLFIMIATLWLLYEITTSIVNPKPLYKTTYGIIVIMITIVVTSLLITLQKYVIKKTNSTAIKADSLHYRSDFLININVLFSLIVTSYFETNIIDVIVGSVITLYIIYHSWLIFKDAYDVLIDKELPENQKKEIIHLIKQLNNKIIGFHDLRTRFSGIRKFIQFHLEMEESITLKEAHKISKELEKKILHKFPEAEIIIHQDPIHKKRTYQD